MIETLFTFVTKIREGAHFPPFCINQYWFKDSFDFLETIRLGIWAREVGIPTMKLYSTVSPPDWCDGTSEYSDAAEALAELTKQK